MNPFFVTGLPRSRSAWVANWLTTDTTFCYHDLPYPQPEIPGKRIGYSGPELLWQFEEIRRQHPDAPWLELIRPQQECLDSFRRSSRGMLPEGPEFTSMWWDRVHRLTKINGRQTKHIGVNNLADEQVAREVWAHLIGAPFDRERWHMLTELNIQQQLDVALERRKGITWPQAQYSAQ